MISFCQLANKMHFLRSKKNFSLECEKWLSRPVWRHSIVSTGQSHLGQCSERGFLILMQGMILYCFVRHVNESILQDHSNQTEPTCWPACKQCVLWLLLNCTACVFPMPAFLTNAPHSLPAVLAINTLVTKQSTHWNKEKDISTWDYQVLQNFRNQVNLMHKLGMLAL